MTAKSLLLAVALVGLASSTLAVTPIEVLSLHPEWSTFQKACYALGLDKDKNWNNAGYQGNTFVPTNQAFENLAKALKTSVANLLTDKATLTNIVAYHITPSWQLNGYASMYNGQILSTVMTRINNRSKLNVIVDAKGNISLKGEKNTAKVNKVKASLKEVTFLQIDTVLLPDTTSAPATIPKFTSAYTAIANTPNLEDFTAILNKHPVWKAKLSDASQTYTVFAPSNNALFNVIKLLGVSAAEFYGNTKYMEDVIAASVLPGQYKTHLDLYGSSGKKFITALAGHPLTVAITHNLQNHVFMKGDLNKAKLRNSQPAPIPTLTPKASGGKYDLLADKHIVHVVDNWILPKTANTP